MDFKAEILKLLNKVYREDQYTNDLLQPLNAQIKTIDDVVNAIINNFFFDKLDIEGCKWYEKLMNITVRANQRIESRRSAIQAKWLSNTHNDILLLQRVCDSWKNGETEVDFIGGKIQIKFIGEYGVPDDLDSLLKTIGEVKPAHLAYYLVYKYLLIKNIHLVKTIKEMEEIQLKTFAFGNRGVI